MRVAYAVVALGMAMTSAVHAAPAQAATQISVSAPQYESPGGIVPVIVTAHGVPSGYRAVISAQGTNGATATCRGPVWSNRRRGTASRKCFLHLPDRPGSYNVRGTARLTRPGALDLSRTGVGARAVRADGYRSAKPMTWAEVDAIERCHNATDHVWLTFDDGGSRSQVTSILQTLKHNRVRGRFFFTGRWAAEHPDLLRRIAAEGHVLANHTLSHPALSRTGKEEVLRQVARGVQGTSDPKLLRPPFGAGAYTTRLAGLAAARGHRLCRWTVDTYDWEGPTATRMVERITIGDHRSPPIAKGGAILMHGQGRYTAPALQQIIDAVRGRGLTLEPL